MRTEGVQSPYLYQTTSERNKEGQNMQEYDEFYYESLLEDESYGIILSDCEREYLEKYRDTYYGMY